MNKQKILTFKEHLKEYRNQLNSHGFKIDVIYDIVDPKYLPDTLELDELNDLIKKAISKAGIEGIDVSKGKNFNLLNGNFKSRFDHLEKTNFEEWVLVLLYTSPHKTLWNSTIEEKYNTKKLGSLESTIPEKVLKTLNEFVNLDIIHFSEGSNKEKENNTYRAYSDLSNLKSVKEYWHKKIQK